MLASRVSFACQLRRFGTAEALVCDNGESLSYSELADRVAAFMARLGTERRLLLVATENAVQPVVAYLAALAGGHAVIMAAEASNRLIEAFRPDAVFSRRDGEWRLDTTEPLGGLHPDLALLLSTSGTTGATKLIRLSASAVDANARSIATYLGLGPDERPLTTLPIHYSYGLSVLNSHLATGGTLLLTGRSLLEHELWDFFDREGGTSLAGVPYSYELLDRIGFWDREHPTLRTLTQAGGRLPAEAAARIGHWARKHGVRFFIMYGQTEATARMAYLPPERLADAPDCIGIAIPGGQLHLEANGAPVTTSEAEGELVYRGPNVMMGYALARSDLERGAEIDALHTGDLAVRRPDGLFRITGRSSRIAKPFGLRISFDEIERQLSEQGLSAAVTGTDQLIAIAVTGTAPAGLASGLASRMKLPEDLFDVSGRPELPRLANGKTDYRTLLAEAEARRAQAATSPETGENAIVAIFRRAFPTQSFDGDPSFAALGGDSLVYVQMSMALEDVLGELPENWESLPISQLEAKAKGGRRHQRSARLDSEMLLRALALIAVIVNHASAYPVGGGSDILMLLAGYSMARFQSSRLLDGQRIAVVRDYFVRVMMPYLAILLAYSVFRKPVSLKNFLLIGNYFPSPGGFLTPFSFLEALLQLYLLASLVFLVPAVRAAGRDDPFRLGLWFVAAGYCVKFAAIILFPAITASLGNRTADAALGLFTLGWLIWFARTPLQKWIATVCMLVLALLTAGVVPSLAIWAEFPDIVSQTRTLWLLAGVVMLLFWPRLPVSALLRTAVARISGAGYHIYLLHGVVVYIVLVWLPQTPLVVTLIGALLLRIMFNAGIGRLNRQLWSRT